MKFPNPEILHVSAIKMIGVKRTMSLLTDQTGLLWQSFMPRRMEVTNRTNADLISLRTYAENFRAGDLNQKFEKWAGAEVNDFSNVPEGFESFEIPAGLYAIFQYTGLNTDPSIYQFIYGEWLVRSGYDVDQRAHFEVLGSKYRNNDPASEETIYIPIRSKE